MVTTGQESRDRILVGVNTLANAVKVTLGAKGRNVIIEQQIGRPHITKDGVTVAKAINPKDNLELMGAQMLQEVANNVVREAGDGTSTSAILAQAICNIGNEYLKKGVNPVYLKKGIEKATKVVVDELKKLSKRIETDEELVSIATISANGDVELGNLIANLFKEIGVEGVVTLEQSSTTQTTTRKVDGIEISSGIVSPYFITNQEKQTCEMEDVYIGVINKPINNFSEIEPLLQKVSAEKANLLLIVDEIHPEALNVVVMNKLRGLLNVAVVKSPSFGDDRRELLSDLSSYTNTKIISPETGNSLENINLDDLGYAKKIISKVNSTVFIDGEKNGLEERVQTIKSLLETNPDDEKLKKRLANLTNSIAVISVGGGTETEISEKIDRVDDAVNAVRSALQEGFVAGGGTTLNYIANNLMVEVSNGTEKQGVEIVKRAIQEPYHQILHNAGLERKELVNYGIGLDLDSGDGVDLFELGIIDPAKVTRVALENASSIGAMFLTTDCVISLES